MLFLIFLLLLSLSGLTLLSACDVGRRYDNEAVIDGVVLLRNKTHKKSLAARCTWDGDAENMEFTVPDEYCGYKVVCLGRKGNPGFTGNPGPFDVWLPDELNGLERRGSYGFMPEAANSENTVKLNFVINIGKYVSELEQIGNGGLYGYGVKNEDGSEDIRTYYRVKIYYNIDEGNSTFYSEDGDIYYKSNGQKVTYRSFFLSD